MWGHLAAQRSIEFAFLASGLALILSPLIGLLMPLRQMSPAEVEVIELGAEPEVALARLRTRFTHADRALQEGADAFNRARTARRVRRRLERPFGSVCWRAETPDSQGEAINLYPP